MRIGTPGGPNFGGNILQQLAKLVKEIMKESPELTKEAAMEIAKKMLKL